MNFSSTQREMHFNQLKFELNLTASTSVCVQMRGETYPFSKNFPSNERIFPFGRTLSFHGISVFSEAKVYKFKIGAYEEIYWES